jgi:hypothetical protein
MELAIKFPEKVVIPKGGILRLDYEPVGLNETAITAVISSADNSETQRLSWTATFSSEVSVTAKINENP